MKVYLLAVLVCLQVTAKRQKASSLKSLYCFYSQTLKDKLSVPYMKLSYFVSPLYMAYSYEEIQGPQHIQLAQLLDDTSFYLNSTFSTLRREVGN